MSRLAPALAVLTVLALSGCSSATATPKGTATPSPEATEPAEVGEVGTIAEPRVAYMAAGGECGGWDQTNVVTLAAESGTCSDTAVMSTYTSEADRDQTVEDARSVAQFVGMHLLVGPNWIINAADVEAVQGDLGGSLVMKDPE